MSLIWSSYTTITASSMGFSSWYNTFDAIDTIFPRFFHECEVTLASLPLLSRFESSKAIFLKKYWSVVRIDDILIQPDNSPDSIVTTKAILKRKEFLCLVWLYLAIASDNWFLILVITSQIRNIMILLFGKQVVVDEALRRTVDIYGANYFAE